MNTTIRYWFPDSQRCRLMSFNTYQDALNAIRLLSKSEINKNTERAAKDLSILVTKFALWNNMKN